MRRGESVRRGNDCDPVGRSALFDLGDNLTVDKDAQKHKDLLWYGPLSWKGCAATLNNSPHKAVLQGFCLKRWNL